MAATTRRTSQVQLGAQLRTYRQAAGMGLEDAAAQLDITSQDLSDLEEGKSCPNKTHALFVLGELYSLTLDRVQQLFELYEECLKQSGESLASRKQAEREIRSEVVYRAISSPSAEAGIFLSYRRRDAAGMACRLYDKLVAEFGSKQVFMDVNSIDLGVDFGEVLERALGQCKAAVVIIGERWLEAEDEDGTRRLNDPEDVVRAEIVSVLNRDILVIPILVEGAAMPRAIDLPEPLKPLARRNGRAISHDQFNRDCPKLIATLQKALGSE
jgi:transcriptional regulator with XRE-family HTH domain